MPPRFCAQTAFPHVSGRSRYICFCLICNPRVDPGNGKVGIQEQPPVLQWWLHPHNPPVWTDHTMGTSGDLFKVPKADNSPTPTLLLRTQRHVSSLLSASLPASAAFPSVPGDREASKVLLPILARLHWSLHWWGWALPPHYPIPDSWHGEWELIPLPIAASAVTVPS